MALDVTAVRDRAKKTVALFTPAQMVLAGLLGAVAIVGGLMFLRWVSAPSYAVLYAGLEQRDAADVTAKLDAAGVKYQLQGGGTTILVPQGQVDTQRLTLAKDGLPSGGGKGWEVLDGEGLTTSSFRQQVDYQRAMEGEIARTLAAMDGVRSAKVHLVMPEERLFSTDKRPASASVLLDTGRRLGDEEVQAVVNLVSGAVPDLDPAQVTISDSTGRVLAGGGATGGHSEAETQAAMRATVEEDRRAKAQSLLDGIVGPGHAVVRVNADVDLASRETNSRTVDPDKQVATGRDTSKETYTAAPPPTAQGPVTTSNTDSAAGSTAQGTGNYEKTSSSEALTGGEVVEKAMQPAGNVQRLSVAVALDDTAKGMPDSADVEKLVSQAVGVDPARGDTITVTRANFEVPAEDPAAGATKPKAGPVPAAVTSMLPKVVGGVLLLAVLAALVLAARRPKIEDLELPEGQPALLAGSPAALPPGRARAELSGGPDVDLIASVENSPDDVAFLLKGWLREEATR